MVTMSKKPIKKNPAEQPDALLGRVAAIRDEARGRVVRAVNTQIVMGKGFRCQT